MVSVDSPMTDVVQILGDLLVLLLLLGQFGSVVALARRFKPCFEVVGDWIFIFFVGIIWWGLLTLLADVPTSFLCMTFTNCGKPETTSSFTSWSSLCGCCCVTGSFSKPFRCSTTRILLADVPTSSLGMIFTNCGKPETTSSFTSWSSLCGCCCVTGSLSRPLRGSTARIPARDARCLRLRIFLIVVFSRP